MSRDCPVWRIPSLNPYSNGIYSMRNVITMKEIITWVLILILLEDTLWAATYLHYVLDWYYVLILILLEDTLWEFIQPPKNNVTFCLNPYSIGRYSMSIDGFMSFSERQRGLNPYSIGRYSMSYGKISSYSVSQCQVLILILLEDTLWVSKI